MEEGGARSGGGPQSWLVSLNSSARGAWFSRGGWFSLSSSSSTVATLERQRTIVGVDEQDAVGGYHLTR